MQNKTYESTTSLGAIFYCISVDPTIIEMHEVMFIGQLVTVLYRADIRKKIIDQSNTKAKETSPCPLKSEKKWKEWWSKFINYLSTLIGVNGVPLYFVVWEKYNTDANGDFPNFLFQDDSTCDNKGQLI